MRAIDNIYPENRHPHFFALLWWFLLLLFVFCFYVAWDLGFVEMVFTRDRSHLTKAIAILTIVASAHAAWFICRYSISLQNLGSQETAFESFADEMDLEIKADRLRAPVEIGWFMVDLAIRLGLAGTIIGFILIFGSLSGEKIIGEDALQELLLSMSGGMGTALFTTLCGLVAATFLSFQYLLLGRQTEHVIAALMQRQGNVPAAAQENFDTGFPVSSPTSVEPDEHVGMFRAN